MVLDGRALIDIEYTALKMLIEAEEKLRAPGRHAVAGVAQSRSAEGRAAVAARRDARDARACSSTCRAR